MAQRKVEVFTAGCPMCEDTVRLVNEVACPSCEVTVHNLHDDPQAAAKAREYGVSGVPAVVVDGKLVECCQRPAVSRELLQAAGIGQAA